MEIPQSLWFTSKDCTLLVWWFHFCFLRNSLGLNLIQDAAWSVPSSSGEALPIHWLSRTTEATLVSHQGHSWYSLLSTRIAAALSRSRASFTAGLLAAMGRTHPLLRLCSRRFMTPHFCSLLRPLWRTVPLQLLPSVERAPVTYIPSSMML